MIVSVKVKDETFKKYVEMDKNMPQRALERTLEHYKDFPYNGRHLFLPTEVLDRLEKVFTHTINDNPERFTAWVERLASLRVDDQVIPLSETQRRRLEREAGKVGRTFDEHTRERVSRAIFDRVGA